MGNRESDPFLSFGLKKFDGLVIIKNEKMALWGQGKIARR